MTRSAFVSLGLASLFAVTTACGTDERAPEFSDVELFQAAMFLDGPAAEYLPESRQRIEASRPALAQRSRAETLEIATSLLGELQAKQYDAKFLEQLENGIQVIAAMDEATWQEAAASTNRSGPGEIAALMQEQNPTFIADFGRAIRSGDHLQIRDAILAASTELASLRYSQGSNTSRQALTAPGEDYALVFNVAVLVNVGVAVNVAVVVALAVAVAVAVEVEVVVEEEEEETRRLAGGLGADMLVNELATAFGS